MVAKVFISYRRDDSAGHAGRVHDRLGHEFGADLLFMDVDSIPLGVNFIKVLRDEVSKCEVLLAVIGPNWLNSSDEEGRRRLDNPNDFVRIEIATALQRDIPVIPILLDGAKIPKISQLPKDLRELAVRNGLEVRHTSFHSDMDKLIRGLKGASGHVDAPGAVEKEEDRRRETAEDGAEAERQSQEERSRQDEEATRSIEEDERRNKGEAEAFSSAVEVRRLRRFGPQRAWRASRPTIVIAGLLALIFAGALVVRLETKPPMQTPMSLPASIALPSAPAAQLLPAPTSMPPSPIAQPSVARAQPAPVSFTPLLPDRERALRTNENFKECNTCPEMVVVPGGSFTMGSPDNEPGRGSDEGPQHRVTFSRQFAVGKYSVTFDEWDSCLADGGCNGYAPSDSGWGRGKRPVININWDDAKAYVAWLSKKTGKAYRLLSEAEREYVTRAGQPTPFWWGSSILPTQANYNARFTYGSDVVGTYLVRTLPIDSFEPNPWGLFQVHGNVWEWVEDCYRDSYHGAPSDGSPSTLADCTKNVLRGGSWDRKPMYLRSAARLASAPTVRDNSFGVRVARTLLAP